MKIAISLILASAVTLEADSRHWESAKSLDQRKRVSGIGFLDGRREPWDEDLLYVADSRETARSVEPAYAVCVAPEGHSGVSAFALLVAAYDRCRTWFDDCMRSICVGDDVEDVFQSATKGLKNPVAFIDEKGALVYRTGEFHASTHGTIWDIAMDRDRMELGFFTESEQASLVQSINAHEEMIFVQPESDPDHELIVVPLYDDGAFCGSMASADLNEPFTPSQAELLRLASQLAFLAVSREAHDTGLVRGMPHYVDRLLSGAAVQEDAVVRQFEGIGWKADDLYMLYRFEIADDDPGGKIIGMYRSKLEKVIPAAIWLRYEGGLVALGRKSDFDGTDPAARRRIDALLVDTPVYCGISSCTIGFMTLMYQYRQCDLALRALTLNSDTHVVAFDSLYPEILRGVLSEALDVRCLCHPAVLRLAESDRPQDAVRLETLRSFLLNGRSVASASRALDVHRNTLLYRLEKLQEEIGADLYNLDNSLLTWLLLSCLIVG